MRSIFLASRAFWIVEEMYWAKISSSSRSESRYSVPSLLFINSITPHTELPIRMATQSTERVQ